MYLMTQIYSLMWKLFLKNNYNSNSNYLNHVGEKHVSNFSLINIVFWTYPKLICELNRVIRTMFSWEDHTIDTL
jgi:hypothetical protein